MNRTIKDYLAIGLKGMAMGAADVVPGVSGGTIAFISGIYEELLSTISNVNLSLLKTLKTSGIKAAWKQLNGSFLTALFLGIFVSIEAHADQEFEYLEHRSVHSRPYLRPPVPLDQQDNTERHRHLQKKNNLLPYRIEPRVEHKGSIWVH